MTERASFSAEEARRIGEEIGIDWSTRSDPRIVTWSNTRRELPPDPDDHRSGAVAALAVGHLVPKTVTADEATVRLVGEAGAGSH